ncbi:hypothetical protein C8Q74DRAFT_1276397 [Fomes fomentarius]|nr:hypothetical protein C8Q74DRAFT_1276397 [Fomes fomentarius]
MESQPVLIFTQETSMNREGCICYSQQRSDPALVPSLGMSTEGSCAIVDELMAHMNYNST